MSLFDNFIFIWNDNKKSGDYLFKILAEWQNGHRFNLGPKSFDLVKDSPQLLQYATLNYPMLVIKYHLLIFSEII